MIHKSIEDSITAGIEHNEKCICIKLNDYTGKYTPEEHEEL